MFSSFSRADCKKTKRPFFVVVGEVGEVGYEGAGMRGGNQAPTRNLEPYRSNLEAHISYVPDTLRGIGGGGGTEGDTFGIFLEGAFAYVNGQLHRASKHPNLLLRLTQTKPLAIKALGFKTKITGTRLVLLTVEMIMVSAPPYQR